MSGAAPCKERRTSQLKVYVQPLDGIHQARRLPALIIPGWPGSLVGAGRG
jgi:hypothetical protein